jgi:hypothetical protein
VAAKLLGLCAVAALALAAPASADQEVVRHGRAIGKLRIGMTLTEVRGLLGRERAINVREARGRAGYDYLELDWDYGWWTAGFMRKPGGTFRAVLVGTGQRAQRTPEGFGLGSKKAELQKRLGARCRTVFNSERGVIKQQECVRGGPGQPQTVFVLETWMRADHSVRVRNVEVRDPLFYRGWRVRFEDD